MQTTERLNITNTQTLQFPGSFFLSRWLSRRFCKNRREIKHHKLVNGSNKSGGEFNVTGMAGKCSVIFFLFERHQEGMSVSLSKHLLTFYVLSPVSTHSLHVFLLILFKSNLKYKNLLNHKVMATLGFGITSKIWRNPQVFTCFLTFFGLITVYSSFNSVTDLEPTVLSGVWNQQNYLFTSFSFDQVNERAANTSMQNDLKD